MGHSRVAALHMYHGRLSEIWWLRNAGHRLSGLAERRRRYDRDRNYHEPHFWSYFWVGRIGFGSLGRARSVPGQDTGGGSKRRILQSPREERIRLRIILREGGSRMTDQITNMPEPSRMLSFD